jgi:hypothetical protein
VHERFEILQYGNKGSLANSGLTFHVLLLNVL